jgi:hypothetical protein
MNALARGTSTQTVEEFADEVDLRVELAFLP